MANPTPTTDPMTQAYLNAAKITQLQGVLDALTAKIAKEKAYVEQHKTSWSKYPGLLQDWASGANTPQKYYFTSAQKTAWASATGTLSSYSSYVYVMKYTAPGYGYPGWTADAVASSAFRSVTGDKTNIDMPADMVAFWLKYSALIQDQATSITTSNKLNALKVTAAKQPYYGLISPKGTLNLNPIINIKYNVGSVKEAYHTSRQQFLDEVTTFGQVNTPSSVTNAAQLWENAKLNKGMIQTNTLNLDQNNSTSTATNTGIGTSGSQAVRTPYAYQFQYNPATIALVYTGLQGVDPYYEATNQDPFNPIGGQGTAGSLSFNILLNRMFDRKYYDPTTRQLAAQYKNIPDLYAPRMPDANEQMDIYNKGTMYDIEYILRAILGYVRTAYLGGRNMSDGFTADFGFIGGYPVEVHLGPSLRYRVVINELVVNHLLFDERMVPIYSSVTVTAYRLIDGPTTGVPADTNGNGGGGAYKPTYVPYDPKLTGVKGIRSAPGSDVLNTNPTP